MDRIENGLDKRKNITYLFTFIILLLATIIGILVAAGVGKTEKQDIANAYDTKYITNLAKQELEAKQKERNLDFSFPLGFQFDNDNFVINYSTYDDEDNNQTNTSISGYRLGGVRFSDTKEGVMILEVIQNRMKVFLEKDKNTIIKVVAYGSADGTSVKSGLKYNGEFGYNTKKIKYYKDNNVNRPLYKEFIAGQTPMTNSDFALLRAYDIVKYMTDRFSISENNIKIFTIEYDEIGEEYRRCDFSITLEKALLLKSEDIENASWWAKQWFE
ncbi:MAG: hypothetical protein LBC89_04665 [Bacteroidales bacterium]|nr:hypothetical protein [Bacteroidales bacterium]